MLAQALNEPASHLWFFSSSEAIDHLAQIVSGRNLRWSEARALATHPRIADRARRLGVGSVFESRPSMAAVVACIQSMRP